MIDKLFERLERRAIANREGTIHTPFDERDRETIRKQIELRRGIGWTEKDIEAYLNLTEEVNPNLQEEPALAQMQVIMRDVQVRLAS